MNHKSGEMGDMERRTKTNIMTCAAIISGVAAAAFWFRSASAPIPEIASKWDTDFRSFMDALRSQAHLSAWAAGLTGVSVICQAFAQHFGKEA
jgi:hypothetical protein